MIDWHSHILPEMDDGSKNVFESLELLKMQRQQGVNTVIATPHFYANDESVDTFLQRRDTSFEKLKTVLPADSPEIVLGAEVRYYHGISKMADLKKLRFDSSKVLLLEMPFCRWTEYMVRELIEISLRGDIKLVLAHVERYLRFQKREVLDRIFDSDIYLQVNASFFGTPATKRKAIALLRDGKIQFIGSDCHNTTSRPPKLDKAYEVIEKKFGKNYISQITQFGYSVLGVKK